MEITLRGIKKSFGAGNVLDGVDLTLRGGEICALLGENGAGKSTLMNIVGGILPADEGEILLDGRKVVFSSPSDSLGAGIAFIHQELNLINDLTVCENMFLGQLPRKGLFLDKSTMISEAKKVFDRIGVDIDPCASVGSLDASYKQTVEIARALLSDASLIIMDEPTASLTSAETDRIFDIMRSLRDKGIAIVFISHKLNEVMEICDSYTVLRNGIPVSSGHIRETTAEKLASYMVGHAVTVGKASSASSHGDEVLRIGHFSDGAHFFDVSLSVRRGEVLGVTGLLGDGRSELFGALFGTGSGSCTGRVTLNGKVIRPSSPKQALACGLAYLPKNRKENAVIPHMSIIDNGTAAVLPRLRKGLFLDRNGQKELFMKKKKELRIRMSDGRLPITSLSGGNQQKVMLARWLLSDHEVLILDNPTQGVDVGAKEEIHSIIDSLAREGASVIVLSSEAQEILRLCSRSVVMYHGRIIGELTGDDLTEQNIMYFATGAGKEKNADER